MKYIYIFLLAGLISSCTTPLTLSQRESDISTDKAHNFEKQLAWSSDMLYVFEQRTKLLAENPSLKLRQNQSTNFSQLQMLKTGTLSPSSLGLELLGNAFANAMLATSESVYNWQYPITSLFDSRVFIIDQASQDETFEHSFDRLNSFVENNFYKAYNCKISHYNENTKYAFAESFKRPNFWYRSHTCERDEFGMLATIFAIKSHNNSDNFAILRISSGVKKGNLYRSTPPDDEVGRQYLFGPLEHIMQPLYKNWEVIVSGPDVSDNFKWTLFYVVSGNRLTIPMPAITGPFHKNFQSASAYRLPRQQQMLFKLNNSSPLDTFLALQKQ